MSELDLHERVSVLESRVHHEFASRLWVKDALDGAIQPLRDAVVRTENAMQGLTANISDLTEQTRRIYATQDAMMKERGQREQEEHLAKMDALRAEKQALVERLEAEKSALREQTWLHVLKEKWIPVAGFIVSLSVIGALLSALLLHYLLTQGVVTKG